MPVGCLRDSFDSRGRGSSGTYPEELPRRLGNLTHGLGTQARKIFFGVFRPGWRLVRATWRDLGRFGWLVGGNLRNKINVFLRISVKQRMSAKTNIGSGGKDRNFNGHASSIPAPSTYRQPKCPASFSTRFVRSILESVSVTLKTPFAFRFQGNRHERSRRAASAARSSPRNALIELVLRKGLDQKFVVARPGRFPQRRAVRRGDARRVDRLA